MTKMNRTKKITISIGIAVLIIAALVGYAVSSGTLNSWFGKNLNVDVVDVTQTLPSQNYDDFAAQNRREPKHDPQILASLERIGYTQRDLHNLDLVVASEAKVQEVCGWEEAGGCLYGDISETSYDMEYYYELYVIDTLTTEEFDLFVAHEYLHYIWFTEELERNRDLVDALYDLYWTNAWIQERIVAHYTEDKNDIATEIFSYGCTELDSETLGSFLSTECNRYINTAALPVL